MSNVKNRNLQRVKIIFLVLVILTVILIYFEYSNINAVNKETIRSEFWSTYFAVIAATMLPLYLFSRESKEREEDENNRDNNEKHTLFINGISTIRPKLQISFLDAKYANTEMMEDVLILKNIGIGNASNINVYVQEIRDINAIYYKKVLIQEENYSNSEFTILPKEDKYVKNIVLETEKDKYISHQIKSFDNIMVIYSNILGSEIYISELVRKENRITDLFYHSTYNFLVPKVIEKDELVDIVNDYASTHSIEHSVYKFQEYITKLSNGGGEV